MRVGGRGLELWLRGPPGSAPRQVAVSAPCLGASLVGLLWRSRQTHLWACVGTDTVHSAGLRVGRGPLRAGGALVLVGAAGCQPCLPRLSRRPPQQRDFLSSDRGHDGTAPDGLEFRGGALGVPRGAVAACVGQGQGQGCRLAACRPARQGHCWLSERKQHSGRWGGAVWARGAVSPTTFP